MRRQRPDGKKRESVGVIATRKERTDVWEQFGWVIVLRVGQCHREIHRILDVRAGSGGDVPRVPSKVLGDPIYTLQCTQECISRTCRRH